MSMLLIPDSTRRHRPQTQSLGSAKAIVQTTLLGFQEPPSEPSAVIVNREAQ